MDVSLTSTLDWTSSYMQETLMLAFTTTTMKVLQENQQHRQAVTGKGFCVWPMLRVLPIILVVGPSFKPNHPWTRIGVQYNILDFEL